MPPHIEWTYLIVKYKYYARNLVNPDINEKSLPGAERLHEKEIITNIIFRCMVKDCIPLTKVNSRDSDLGAIADRIIWKNASPYYSDNKFIINLKIESYAYASI